MKTEALEEIRAVLAQADKEALAERVSSLQPYDLSEMLREMDHQEQLRLISMLPLSVAAETLEYIEPELQYRILHHLEDEITSPLLKRMSSDTVVDMLLAIHPLQAARLLDLLPEDYRKKIDTLMTFPEDTAGSLATVDYISAREGWTVEQTLNHVRKVGHEAEIISYIYVTNVRGELVGVVSLKEIILAPPGTRLSEIVTEDVIAVTADTEQEEAAELLFRYDFVALPVIDAQKRMIGIIAVDDLIDVIQEVTTEDFQKLGGSQPLTEPYFKTSVWGLFRKRIGWLLFLFVGGAYTANVLSHYNEAMSKIIALSFFVPLLIGTGGNTGSQIVSMLVRALGMGEVQFSDLFRVVRKELMVGVFLGVAMGLVGFLRAYLLGVSYDIGMVVALSALAIVIWASFVAAILPLVLHRLRIDPAVVSGPFISTLVDGTGLIIYFTIAQMLLHV
jgi:magnesium transporter